MNYFYEQPLDPSAEARCNFLPMESRNGRELDFCWPLFLAFCEATSVSILGIGSQLPLGGLVTFCGRPRLREYDNAILLGVVVTLRLNYKNFIWQWENLAIEIEQQSSIAAHQLIKEVSFTAQAIALKRPIITDVLLMPWPASLFVHEVVGHTLEADNLMAVPELIIPGSAATKVPLTVIDDPSLSGTRTLFAVDDMGHQVLPIRMIADGFWHGVLSCSRTWKSVPYGFELAMRNRRTQAGRKIIPRQSNTFLLPQQDSPEDLIRRVEDGFLLIGGNGGGSAIDRFFIQPVVAQRIREGALVGEFISDFVMAGDKFQVLKAISSVGNDFRMFSPYFGCDKNGENQLPVCHGAPSLLLEKVGLYPLNKLSWSYQ